MNADTALPPAFLSVRLPSAARDRLKAITAARGETVQVLVGQFVERFLSEQDRAIPTSGVVVGLLRAHVADLAARGVAGLWVFGSVA